MKVLSLFNGISCARVALEKAGISVDRYVSFEIDKYANAISKYRYPNDEYYLDVSSADFSPFKGFDLIIGGSPCQGLSIAKNNREGLEDKRSGLFWELARAINEIKPRYFLVENVASMDKGNKEIITKALGVEAIMINSALVSAQNRKRLYWTNIPNVTLPEDKNIFLQDILDNSAEIDRSLMTERNLKQIRAVDKKAFTCIASMYKGAGNNGMSLIPIRIGQVNKGGQSDRVYNVEGKSICLSSNSGGIGARTCLYKIDLPDGEYVIRKLLPLECERLQTLPDKYTEKGVLEGKLVTISNTQRYKALGNGFTVDVIAHILKNIKERG